MSSMSLPGPFPKDPRPAAPLGRPPEDPLAHPSARLAGCSKAARLLVLSADGSEPAFAAIRQALDHMGTPYTPWVVEDQAGLPNLAQGHHALYQGVILA